MQYLQTPELERRTKRIIPGFRPVRSLLDAVGPSLLSATDLASRYGIEGEICRPLNHILSFEMSLFKINTKIQVKSAKHVGLAPHNKCKLEKIRRKQSPEKNG